MCGRYVSPEEAEFDREYQIDRRNADVRMGKALAGYQRSFNVSPTQSVPVVRVIRESQGERVLTTMRWGLVPFWAKGVPQSYSTINATVEKIATAPTWRGPWKRGQRCVMPCSGFYEWQVNDDGSKQPYYIRPVKDNSTFAMAALWDESVRDDGESIVSCAAITVPANPLMAEIHNVKQRMPAILHHEDIAQWLSGTAEQAMALLVPYPEELMLAYPVSKRVNTPKNNDEKLIEPLVA